MTRADLVANLGTIAKSGTSAFLDTLAKGGDLSLIGQFGVGFYSVYLVADRVQVVSKHNGEAKQWVWESAADGAFTVAEDKTGEPLGRGTLIRLHIKEDKPEYLDIAKLRGLVAKYSEFVGHPIYLYASKEESREVPDDAAPTAPKSDDDDVVSDAVDDAAPDAAADADAAPKTKTVTETVWAWERLNDVAPIWLRPPTSVPDADHLAFYRAISKSSDAPLARAHFRAEGDVEFRALVYVPGAPPPNFYENYYSAEPSLKLYVRRVFVSDDFKDLVPRYLSFLRGVVDSDTLPLSVSRETLQASPALKTIKKKVVRKALDVIKKLADAEAEEGGKKKGFFARKKAKSADADDTPTYAKFWTAYGRALKLGVLEDAPNRARLARLLRFKSSAVDGGNVTSLEAYVGRMKPGQKSIFYLAGESAADLAASPFAEKLLDAGLEVLYMDDAVDEYMMQQLTEFDDFKFANAAKEGLKLDDGGDAASAEDAKSKAKAARKAFKPVATWWAATLGGGVSSVKLSTRLTKSPAVVVTSQYGWSANMERIMKAQALSSEGKAAYMRGAKTLEVNPRHALVRALIAKHAANPDDPAAADLARGLYEAALLESGFALDDAKAFVGRVHALLGAAHAPGEDLTKLVDPVLPAAVEEEKGGKKDEL